MIWLLALFGCINDDWSEPEHPPVTDGAPLVGAAEGALRLPIGTPLSGFTARCTCLGGSAIDADDRQSAYNTAFIESVGVQTHPSIRAIWVENGDQSLVLLKTDNIYSFDGLVDAVEAELTARTGEDLTGRVVHTTNHTHSSYGTYSHAETFYLGSDKFNQENFTRMVGQMADVAEEAYNDRQAAKIGMSWTRDWDPDNQVYSDRRGINNDLNPWGESAPDWVGEKDPWLGLIRFDTLADEPIAVLLNFGIHGIVMDADSPMVSGDSALHIELRVAEAFDEPVVVMHTQSSGGDQSPRGRHDDYARLESLGDLAVDPIMDAWAGTPTSADPIRLDTVSRSIPQHPSQIRVTRNGTVDWSYAPYEEGRVPDDVVYDDNGEILTPLDEFNSRVGHVFCGTGDLDFPVGRLDSNAYPYTNCLDVDLLSALIKTFFKLDEMTLPLPESLKAGTTASRIGPIPVVRDGTETEEDLLLGVFPGETTSLFVEQYKRRAAAEAGYDNTMVLGYAQDHEGYLLIPEDWLLGEYEADIVLWGPLQGEHILEGNLQMVNELLNNDVLEPSDPLGLYARTTYPEEAFPELQPDLTPEAGTRLTEPPEYLFTPLDIPVDLSFPTEVPRGQRMVQMAWEGGDPGVDHPRVRIERNDGGTWTALTTRAGRVIDEGMPDILLATTPDPLAPFVVEQSHRWWMAWEAIDHAVDRMGLPTGTYRIVVEGQRYTGGNTTWPWNTEAYEVISPEFEVVPSVLDLAFGPDGLTAAFVAHRDNFRLVHLDGDPTGDNPLEGDVTVDYYDGTTLVDTQVLTPIQLGERSVLEVTEPTGPYTEIHVTDAFGNTGKLTP